MGIFIPLGAFHVFGVKCVSIYSMYSKCTKSILVCRDAIFSFYSIPINLLGKQKKKACRQIHQPMLSIGVYFIYVNAMCVLMWSQSCVVVCGHPVRGILILANPRHPRFVAAHAAVT